MSRSALARLGLLAAIWGCSFLFIKVALEGLSPAQLVLGRLAAGALVLLPLLAARRQRLPRRPVIWAHLAAAATVGNVLPFLLFAWGEQRISSGRAGVLNATTPLCTVLVAIVVLPDERPTPARVAGLVLGFLGAVVVVAPWADQVGADVAGQLACLLAAACYGIAFVYIRRNLSGAGLSSVALAAGQLLAATVLLGVLSPLVARGQVHPTARVVLSVLALGGLGTGLAYVVVYGLVRDAGATTASMVTYLVPVTAVALGALLLHERFGWNVFVGAAIVVTGVALAEGRLPWPDRRRPAARARGTP